MRQPRHKQTSGDGLRMDRQFCNNDSAVHRANFHRIKYGLGNEIETGRWNIL